MAADIDEAGDSQLHIVMGPSADNDFIEIFWLDIPDIDITAGGTHDAFALEVASYTQPVSFLMGASDGTNGGTDIGGSSSGSLASCCEIVIFPFADFSGSIDFTSINQISLILHAPFGSTDMEINALYTIPEPGSAWLLMAGLAGLAVRRRR